MSHNYYIKIGGSLMSDLFRLDEFLTKLISIFGSSLIINVGSGYIGEAYKRLVTETYKVNMPYIQSVQNWAMIQLINANIISAMNPNYIIASSEENIEKILKNGKNVIIDPVFYSNELSIQGLNTSDLKAAYLCNKLKCDSLIIFTDVDGVYTSNPKLDATARKISVMTPEQLGLLESSCLDNGIEKLLSSYHLTCHVLGIEEFLDDCVAGIDDVYSCGTAVVEDISYEKN